MTSALILDKTGRITIPRRMRDHLGWKPGDTLEMVISGKSIVLRRARQIGRLYKKRGLWVFHSGTPLTVDIVNKTLRRIRAERDRKNFGQLK